MKKINLVINGLECIIQEIIGGVDVFDTSTEEYYGEVLLIEIPDEEDEDYEVMVTNLIDTIEMELKF